VSWLAKASTLDPQLGDGLNVAPYTRVFKLYLPVPYPLPEMAVDSEPTSPTGGGSIIPKPTNKEMPSGQNDGRHGSLKRDLSPRDLNMIAIAGSVGTGLIIGIGASLTIGESSSVVIARVAEILISSSQGARRRFCSPLYWWDLWFGL
jgi:hypothetical protein